MLFSSLFRRWLNVSLTGIVSLALMLAVFAPAAYGYPDDVVPPGPIPANNPASLPVTSPQVMPRLSDLAAWSPRPLSVAAATLPVPTPDPYGSGTPEFPAPTVPTTPTNPFPANPVAPATSLPSQLPSQLPGPPAVELARGIPQPRMLVRPANPTNFGPRFSQDTGGTPVNNPILVVLHETVGSGSSAINLIQSTIADESRQVSYHAILLLDGTVVFMVPPEFRAFGAGNSIFRGEAVKTHPIFPASVNNFAYHISLETPADGRHNGGGHSGYTPAQYRSLAWLVARTGVPTNRITTHREVDRSGMRRDPRSFNNQVLSQLLRASVGPG
jgi:hypothetical protein